MRAALLTEYGKPLEIEEVSTAPLGPRDARVRINASGVCHSDVTIAAGGIPGMELPVILGHEGSGTILETGAEVTRVKTGDRVILALFPVCGICFHCIRDESHLCESLGALSMTPRMRRADGSGLRSLSALGTFADEAVIDETLLVKVDTDLPDEELALLGCGVTTGVGAALNTARVTPGATVAVVGCGGVGQSVLQGARIAGASRIFAVDPVELKRKTAEQLGATDLIDPGAGDPVEQVKAATGGRGVDFSFEVLGRPETTMQAYGMARRHGTVTLVGMGRAEHTVTFSMLQLLMDEKRFLPSLYGSSQARRDLPRFVSLVETGRLDLGSMVSRRIKLDEVNDAFRAMEAGEVIRSVIV
jgi:S-(hydroxymethyl)glutathione dehydrogenase / alcohol dehydrogenase